MAQRVQLRKKTRKSFLSRRKSRKSRRESRRGKQKAQRGGATLDIAEDYPWASVTTLDSEGVPQTRSVSSFIEGGRDDADPEAPAAEQGLNG
jgi:hypothetical protein